MARFCILLVCALTIQYCHAKCDSKTIDAIKNLRKDQDDSNLLESLPGEYEFVYASLGPMTSLVSSQCFKATFTKDDSGYKVVYNGPVKLEYKIIYEDKAIVVIDDKGEKTYSAHVVYYDADTKVMAVYTCRPKGLFSFTFSAIAVSTASKGVADSVKAAKNALLSIGVKDGTTTGCSLE